MNDPYERVRAAERPRWGASTHRKTQDVCGINVRPNPVFKPANPDLVVAGVVTPTTDAERQVLKEVGEVINACNRV